MKILIISAVFPPEPTVSANISYDLATYLAKKVPVIVIAPNPTRPFGAVYPNFDKQLPNNEFELYRTSSYTYPQSHIIGRMRESYSFGCHVSRWIRKHHTEIGAVYINSWPLCSQYLIAKAAKKYDIPIVLHIQDIYPESLIGKLKFPGIRICEKVLRSFDRLILKKATSIIGISRYMIKYLAVSRKIPENKFVLIRNWQQDELFAKIKRKLLSEANSIFTLMYVGNISASACVDTIIRAFHMINNDNVKMVIAGDGTQKNLCIKLAKELHIQNISFCSVSPDQVPQLQAEADCLILSLKEGVAATATPSKITAYCLSGKPIIACVDSGSDVDTIISSSKCGVVVPPENVSQLFQAMQNMIGRERSELKIMGENAVEFARQHLSRNSNLIALSNVIYDCYGKNKTNIKE